ncbi:bestrophin family protein [Phytohalomonas tamaricis]|uniref:bestrophin family protein n=1 Tax=Phytohalomonas tamaricis TaxID=2081032 RepID=UPI0021D3F382|nr:bestrophin family ion channel [Phytohalomonas tamaricis]
MNDASRGWRHLFDVYFISLCSHGAARMVVRDNPGFLKLFLVMRGSTLPKILPQVLVIMAIGMLVAELHRYFPRLFPAYSTAPFTLLGISLSLFLGFRNNACYDRWWEARRHWGQLLIDSRSLMRQANAFLDLDTPRGRELQRRFGYLVIAFAHAMRHRLRGTDAWPEIAGRLDEADRRLLEGYSNLPTGILQLIGQTLGVCLKEGRLSDILIRDMDQTVSSMSRSLGACERIHSTPVPFAYMLLLHRTAYLYCFLLPWGLVGTLGLATPVVCGIIAYTFFGLDRLSEELGAPFGLEANALPLDAISRTIEINVLEALGEPVPPPLEPQDHILL